MMTKSQLAVKNQEVKRIDNNKAQKQKIEEGTGRIPKKGGYYNVGNLKNPKFEADAWRVQEEANDAKVRTEIIKTIQTGEYAEAIVRATPLDGESTDAIVHHDYDTIMNKKLMEMLKKELAGKNIFFGASGKRRKIQVFKDIAEPFIINENGKTIPNLTPEGMIKILDDMFQFKDISLRDAVTKAMRIAQLKALNKDWRDKEEIKAEEDEVKAVNNGKEVPKVDQETVDKTLNPEQKPEQGLKPEGDKIKEKKGGKPSGKTKLPPKEEVETVDMTGKESSFDAAAQKNPTVKALIHALESDKKVVNTGNIVALAKDRQKEGIINKIQLKKVQKDLGVLAD